MRRLACLAVAAVSAGVTALAQTVVLDNTDDGTAFIDNTQSTLSSSTWQAKIITTPTNGAWSLDSLLMSLYQTNAALTNSAVTVFLRAVDADNNPTGTNLASTTFDVPLTTNAAYYRLPLDHGEWALEPSTKYALIFSADTGTQWTKAGVSLGDPYETFAGFEFIMTRRTANSGSLWISNGTFNGLQIVAVNAGEGPTNIVIDGVTYTNNTFRIDWTATPAGPVGVQRRAALDVGNWSLVSSNNTNGTFTDTSLPVGGKAFYRVVAP